MQCYRFAGKVDTAKPARIIESQGLVIGQLDINMIMLERGLIITDYPQAAGHAQVQYQRTLVSFK